MTAYRLVPSSGEARPPALDEAQRRVVERGLRGSPGGPLLVLGGPGTGKSTVIAEAVIARLQEPDADPAGVLAFAFSRRSAERLREQVQRRLGRTLGAPIAMTFHSFAYALVREHSPAELYDAPLRLLSAPEQDAVIRELLADAEESIPWPESLSGARGTRGFAKEVEVLLARARVRGFGAHDLVALGERIGSPMHVSAGRFLAQYLDVLDGMAAIDYPDLMVRAVALAEEHAADLRKRYTAVFVDEYQEIDRNQERLLRALVGEGGDLVAAGDPGQSIFQFRGGDPALVERFPERFAVRGRPAETVELTTRHRGLPETTAHTFDTERDETEWIADRLRRAHLEDDMPWGDMAVVVRSGTQVDALSRSLPAAGVPVELDGADLPLLQNPAVGALLDALETALDSRITDASSSRFVDAERAESFLLSAVGGYDAAELRLRLQAKRRTAPESDAVALLRAELHAHPLAAAVLKQHARGATAEELLWLLWNDSGWQARLVEALGRGGFGARLAHRDLDAVVALFDLAAKLEEQRGHADVASFVALLRAQDVPSDTLAGRGYRGDAVRLLTAHQAKGLEWPLVVVAHVQEESWPNLRLRNTLLGADRLDAPGLDLLPPGTRAALLRDERRLFHVALSRATTTVEVTAVASADEEGEQPSRFLESLAPDTSASPRVHRPGRVERPLNLTALTAELRRVVVDDTASAALRNAAGERLRRIGRLPTPVARAADPGTWWGLAAPGESDEPLAGTTVRLSASAVEAILDCPARWFLERRAGGSRRAVVAASLGTVVHAIARHISQEGLTEADLDTTVRTLVEDYWSRLPAETPWSSAVHRQRIVEALRRFLLWHAANPREVLGEEVELATTVEIDGVTVSLYGFADRIEVDAEGHVVVVDLKTTRWPAPTAAAKENVQLGFYQYALERGAAPDLVTEGRSVGEAMLVQLAKADGDRAVEQVRPALDDDARAVVEGQLREAVRVITREELVATPGRHCEHCSFHAICPAQASGVLLA